jgi:hypothetical protein
MKKKKNRLFKEISVWRQIDGDTVSEYRCLQVLPDGGYCVKSSHFYRSPLSSVNDVQINEAGFYFLDGMFGGGLEELTKQTFKTLEVAIKRHDEDFDDSFE